jgi:hypothetical protein
MPDIRYHVDVDTSGMKNAANDFDSFKQKISAVMGVTDPGKVEQFWDEYNSGLENQVKILDKIESLGIKQNRGKNLPSNDSSETNWAKNIFSFGHTVGGLVGGATRDATGAVVSAGSDIFGDISKMWKDLPVPAKIAMGGAGAVISAGFVGNELSKQYESVAPQVISATAALGRFGETAKEQSENFRTTMRSITNVSAEYGYKMTQGAQTIESLMRSGAQAGNATALSEDIMRQSRSLGYASPLESLSSLSALGSRFGLAGNLSNYALGSAKRTVGWARTDEQAQALLSMLQGNVSGGINLTSENVKTMVQAQNWLYGTFGERAAGMGGAAMYQNLSGAQAGATSLSSTGNMLLYESARKPGENYIDTMSRLESGFSPQIFEQYKKSISGSSSTEQIELVRQAYGVNYTVARDMLSGKIQTAEAYNVATGPGAAIKNTTEVDILKYQEQIAGDVRNIATGTSDVKAGVLRGVSAITGLAGNRSGTYENLTSTRTEKSVEEREVKARESARIRSGYVDTSASENVISSSFVSLLNANAAFTGKGGDVKSANMWLYSRYGLDTNEAQGDIQLMSGALKNKDFVKLVTEKDPTFFNKIADINKQDKTDWSSKEIKQAAESIKSEAGTLGILTQILNELKTANSTPVVIRKK